MAAVIQCKHCPRTTRLTEAGARSIGWRMFTGISITGKQLEDVACPSCSGRGDHESTPPSWDVMCRTCGWQFSDEMYEDDPPLLSAWEAEQVAGDHHCDTDFVYREPGSDEWKPAYEYRDKVSASIPKQRQKQ